MGSAVDILCTGNLNGHAGLDALLEGIGAEVVCVVSAHLILEVEAVAGIAVLLGHDAGYDTLTNEVVACCRSCVLCPAGNLVSGNLVIEGSRSGLAVRIRDSSGKNVRNIVCGLFVNIDLGHLIAGNDLNVSCVSCPGNVVLNAVYHNDRNNIVIGCGNFGALLIHAHEICLSLLNIA